MSYPAWALDTYLTQVAPMLAAFCGEEVECRFLETCGPGGDGPRRFRLFPGSLHLLWVEALGQTVSDAHIRVAAALECLHNASLHHDDVLDEHDSRRGEPTLRALLGPSGALLAGDALVGLAFEILAVLGRDERSGRVLQALAKAWGTMTSGQVMDEPATWRGVAPAARLAHWKQMSRSKLAIGNVAAPLAALLSTRADQAARLAALHESFSLVSQIMNDIGDCNGWAGFHAVAPCTRSICEETSRKPTLLALSTDAADLGGADPTLIGHAEEEIRRLTADALHELEALSVASKVEPVLVDFFERPLREFARAVTGGRPHDR